MGIDLAEMGRSGAAPLRECWVTHDGGTLFAMLESLISILVSLPFMIQPQLPRVPDVEVQRTAMKKLSFLVGRWSG